MIFENIIGNQKNKKILEDIIIKNKIANAYMFIGQESIGKFLFAKEFWLNVKSGSAPQSTGQSRFLLF